MRSSLRLTMAGIVLAALAGGAWVWRSHSAATDIGKKIPEAIQVAGGFVGQQ